MPRFLFLLLVVAMARPAAAQKVIEKTAPVTAGQRVFLDLRQATSIRVRTGPAGQLALKATVSINQNRLNDALQLTVAPSAEQLRVTADFDKEMLKKAQPGDCASYDDQGHGRNMWYGQQVCDDIAYEITLPADVALRVFTYSGNVDIVGFSNAIEAKSLSGFVDVSWPDTKGAELSLKTLNGEVYTDQDIAFSTALRRNPDFGYWLQGTLKGSGPVVKLESISNDVYFRKRK
jgi:hypothetical protein